MLSNKGSFGFQTSVKGGNIGGRHGAMVVDLMGVLAIMVLVFSLLVVAMVFINPNNLVANRIDSLKVVLVFFIVHVVNIILEFVKDTKIDFKYAKIVSFVDNRLLQMRISLLDI